MQSGFRFRCYPDSQQAQALLRWIGCQRFIYNAKVGEDRYFRSFARKSLQHTGQHAPQDQQYAHFITDDTAWLRDVPSVVLRNGSVRWKRAYGRYWKKLAGRRAGLKTRSGDLVATDLTTLECDDEGAEASAECANDGAQVVPLAA